jgi:hypothetical protein
LGVIEKFSTGYWLYNWTIKEMAETGKSAGLYRLLVLPLQNRNTLGGLPYIPAIPGFPPSNALSVKKMTRYPIQ